MRRVLSGTAAAVSLLGAAGAVALATAPAASAATCTSPTVVYHTPLTYSGRTYGYVDLEYSTACHSARAHVHSIYKAIPGDSHGAWGTIKRVGANVSKTCSVTLNNQDCRTGWLYDLSPYTAKASGDIDLYASDSTSGGYHDATGTTPAY